MKKFTAIIKTIFKIILGIILGLAFSFVTIACLELFLPRPNPFRREGTNLWLVGPIIAAWLLLMLWLALRKPSPKNIRTKGLENLPTSVSDLIDGIIDAMRFRKNVRAEVRQELTDHFTDALADCEDEQEKQKRIKQLIEDFGNIELLGTLIRRGKKRCQPLWHKILTHIPHTIGILILLLILYIGWFFTGRPQISTDYLAVFNQRVRPTVDENLNAWPYYEQAVQSYVKPKLLNLETGTLIADDRKEKETNYQEDEIIELDPSPRRFDAVSQQEMQILNQWLADNRDALDLIHQGNQKPYCWRNYSGGEHDPTELIGVLVPDLSEFRELARLLCWQALTEAAQNHFNESLESTLESYSLGQHIRGQNTTLIEQLVGIAIEAISTKTCRILLHEYVDQTDTELLSRIRQQFQQMIDKTNFVVSFEGEKLCLYDEVQRCFTESRFGKSHLFLPRLMMLGSPNIEDEEIGEAVKDAFRILFTHPDKTETLKAIDTFYDYMDEIAQKTPATLKEQDIDLSSQTEKLVQGNLFLEMLTPALGKVIEISYRLRIDIYATLTTLAIFEYQKEYGRYPDSLDELVQHQLLKKVPLDPFSNQPIKYQKTTDDFILYSVGSNFTDDGGVPATDDEGKPRQWGDNGDWIFWPVSKD